MSAPGAAGGGGTRPLQVAIVGGGITGLSAAYHLHRLAGERGVPCRIVLFEREQRLGGKVRTERVEGSLLEAGPDCFLTRKPWMAQLCRSVGLGDQLVDMGRPGATTTFLLAGGKLHRLPPGSFMGIPAHWRPLLASGIVSWRGVLRFLAEPLVPPRRGGGEESLAAFARRRLGYEVSARLVEPLLSGIYGGDAHTLGVEATFPMFREWEQRYGSLRAGLKAMRRGAMGQGRPGPQGPGSQDSGPTVSGSQGLSDAVSGSQGPSNPRPGSQDPSNPRPGSRDASFADPGGGQVQRNGSTSSGSTSGVSAASANGRPGGAAGQPREEAGQSQRAGGQPQGAGGQPGPGKTGAPAMFQTLQGGLESGIDELRKHLVAAGVQLHTGVGVRKIVSVPGAPRHFRLFLENGEEATFDRVILAAPAPAAAGMLAEMAPEAAAHLRDIPYRSAASVYLGYRREDVPHPLDGTGYIASRDEERAVTAATWVSSKWPHTVDGPGTVVIRCHMGSRRGEDPTERDDEELIAEARNELASVMGIRAEPRFHRIFRWPNAMPQYVPGHQRWLDKLEEALSPWPGLVLAGAAYRGVGLPDCVRQGQEAAERILLEASGSPMQSRVASLESRS